MVTNKGIYETQTEVQGEAMTDEQRAREWYEKGLERVTREQWNILIENPHSGMLPLLRDVLTRELGPLLAALGMIPNDVMFNHLTREQMVSFRAAKQAFLEGSDGKG